MERANGRRTLSTSLPLSPFLSLTMPDPLPRTRPSGSTPAPGEVLIKVPPERAVMTPTWELLEHVKGERERQREKNAREHPRASLSLSHRRLCAHTPLSWALPRRVEAGGLRV